MRTVQFKLAFILTTALLGQGCATQGNLYYWGEYQPVIYDIYANPGKADSATQIYKLNETIAQAENYGKKVPPGVYAHLGLVHAQVGNPGLAKASLLKEKQLYPEASLFIDGILSRSNMSDEQLNATIEPQMEKAQ